jgi:serine/threonine protein kinase
VLSTPFVSTLPSRTQCLFAMLAGFFPLDRASSADWRFERLQLALSTQCSLSYTIYGFYDKHCTLSKEVTDLIDGLMNLKPSVRLTARDVLDSVWVRGDNSSESMDVDVAMAPRYRNGHTGKPSQVAALAAAIADAAADDSASRPFYRSGTASGKMGAVSPPELERQLPMLPGEADGFRRLLREATFKMERLSESGDLPCVIC